MDASALERAIDGELRLMRSETRGDLSLLDGLLDDDFVEIGASGRVWTRPEVIADRLASWGVDVEVVGMSARQIVAQIILVTYTTVSEERRVLRSSWWRETEGRWRCLFHQGTIATATGP